MKRKEILEKAIKCVCGDRDQDYGNPESSFNAIADYWKVYLQHNCVGELDEVSVTAKDVAIMMCLFKIARIDTGHGKEDNWVDLAGYAANGAEIESNEDKVDNINCEGNCEGCIMSQKLLDSASNGVPDKCLLCRRFDSQCKLDNYESIWQ
nr:MAG TPA: hypothetical protein [Caudoviricetes sp.]